MFKVGITEQGDAGLDFSWVNKLCRVNIIISKELNDELIENLIKHKNKIIFHMTCTGHGATKLEPNVPSVQYTHNQITKLIKSGFPPNQIVLRVDPIIPTAKGINTVREVLDLFKGIGIIRVRYSFIDMYPHVIKRFTDNDIKLPFKGFSAPQKMIDNTYDLFKEYEHYYRFESCAERDNNQVGCISELDMYNLGIEQKILPNFHPSRLGCLCPRCKTELLKNKTQCGHGCLYCYWKDKE